MAMAVPRLLLIPIVIAALVLTAGRVGPCESQAQEGEVTPTQDVERISALSGGGDPSPEPIVWRESRALGLPFAGRPRRGVRLPSEDAGYFTWDPVRKTTPNRWWRRNGTDRLVRTLLDVLGEFQ